MLKFNQLTLSQKRFVVAVLEGYPQFREDPVITLKQCASIYYDLKDKRQGMKGEKVGYPNWLFKANKLDRGQYKLPVPTADELMAYGNEASAKANPVRAAKAKVISLSKTAVETQVQLSDDEQRLQNIIDESLEYEDWDAVSDFDSICAEAGINIGYGNESY